MMMSKRRKVMVESQRAIKRRRKVPWREPDAEVEAVASALCEQGGAIEAVVREKSDTDLVRAAAIAERVATHAHEVAGRLAREAAEQALRESGTSKLQTYTHFAELLGRSRTTLVEKLKLY
jgi:DNA-binding NtrC family response regulator